MTISDDEDESLAQFLESEVLSQVSDREDSDVEGDQPNAKKLKAEQQIGRQREDGGSSSSSRSNPRRIETGILSKVPPELFRHILKFLSCEDLISCSLVCQYLNYAAADESLWRRLYYLRWGVLPPRAIKEMLRGSVWKKLYEKRDGEDLIELVKYCPSEFKENYYYTQMQAAKRSQAPLPSQVKDDYIILDKTVADQVSNWKSKMRLNDIVASDHTCYGETCTFHKIGDVYICEKTGLVHVCDYTCKAVVLDTSNMLFVCTISGRCFDNIMSPSEEIESDSEQFEGGVTDDAEPFMGSGRFARAYQLGYNCSDEKELEATLRFC